MSDTYYIEQKTQYQWEVIPEGDFSSLNEALSGMRELETNLGWRNLRVKCPDGEIVYGQSS